MYSWHSTIILQQGMSEEFVNVDDYKGFGTFICG
jgi:hypothetical protein